MDTKLNDFLLTRYEPDSSALICCASAEFIPLRDFKDSFEQIARQVEKFPVKNFVFDKSLLRTFDQKSMEWYYMNWKPKVKQFGLVNHYKILPELPWFLEAVNAGRISILENISDDRLDQIQITYVKDQESAMHAIRKTNGELRS